MAASDQTLETNYYKDWMRLQEQELTELQHAAHLCSEGRVSDDELRQLINKIMIHFQSYIQNRAHLARADVCPYFSPTWCTSLERSVMWLGGCRPSSYIRLIYSLTGLQVEADFATLLSGTGSLPRISGLQLAAVNELQRRTIDEEKKLSRWVEILQQDVVEQPLVAIALKAMGLNCEPRRGVGAVLGEHGMSMLEVMRVADRMRMDTLKELLDILTPQEAVNFLAAGKKLQLCLAQWGREIDSQHGRN